MRRIGAWGLSIAILLVLTSGVRSADPPWRRVTTPPADSTSATPSSSSGGWFSNWFGSSGQSSKQRAQAKADSAKANKAKDQAAGERARAQAAFLRRMAVCNKLEKIGFDTGNEELQRTAQQLLERAEAAYSQRYAQLRAATDGLETDEQILEKHPGAKNAQEGRSAARKENP